MPQYSFITLGILLCFCFLLVYIVINTFCSPRASIEEHVVLVVNTLNVPTDQIEFLMQCALQSGHRLAVIVDDTDAEACNIVEILCRKHDQIAIIAPEELQQSITGKMLWHIS